MSRDRDTNRGALQWDFLTTFVAARRAFLAIYRRYERRVLAAAKEGGVNRADLQLPPQQLWKLFHRRRLVQLRDGRLAALRRLAGEIFGVDGDEGLMDAYCGHIFHEISILSEEHRSVGRFVRHHDPRRYRALFEEVSGYYPVRLNRVQRLFRSAMKRLDELLPRWSRDRVFVRSMYLSGNELAKRAYGTGLEAFYFRMYPNGGLIRGYLEAGRSFYNSGFQERARVALGRALEAFEEAEKERELRPGERRAVEEVRELMSLMISRGNQADPVPSVHPLDRENGEGA
jgi:hypothetical protein